MKRICVYCGSSAGARPVYADAACHLAEVLYEQGLELVYGGAAKGTMGVIADRMLALGGKVHGVIPEFLRAKEIAHAELSELHVVASMHERKSLMAELSDGFIALPGGFGTLEEIVEIVIDGYFDALLQFLGHAEAEGFLRAVNRDMLLAESDAAALLKRFRDYRAPNVEKWLS